MRPRDNRGGEGYVSRGRGGFRGGRGGGKRYRSNNHHDGGGSSHKKVRGEEEVFDVMQYFKQSMLEDPWKSLNQTV